MSELQLVYREKTYRAQLVDLDLDARASDSQVKDAAERYFDLARGALKDHQVTRPGFDRILVSERAIFGSTNIRPSVDAG